MATLALSENFLATCSRERLIVTSLRGVACLKYELKANDCKSEGDLKDKDELGLKISKKEANYIIDCRFSPLEKYFAICSSYKQLLVWETVNWKLVHTREIPRKPMKLLFSQNEDIALIADKTGNVYRFDFKAETPEHLLGHLSVILDMALSPNDKQLVTCDRDGKIRVSCYPNCYNIDKFLMAHTSCVTSFAIDKDDKYLVSIDGEKQIFLWDMKSGHFLDNSKIDIEGELIPRKVCMDKMFGIYVLVDSSKFVFTFEIKEEMIKTLGKIALESIPLDLLCDGQDIILLQQSIDHPVLCYHISEERELAKLEKSSRLSGVDQIRQFVHEPLNLEPWKCSGWQDDDN